MIASDPAGVLAAVESSYGLYFEQTSPARASVSFVGVDPIEVLRFAPGPGELAYLTLGMSRHPMTGADAAVLAADGPRAELMLVLRDPAAAFADIWRTLAVLAAAPAVEGVVYSPGNTVEVGQPLVAGSQCTGALLDPAPLAPVQTPAGTVQVLALTPATANELAWCRVRGAAELQARWTAAGTDLLDLARGPVELTG